jgi:hypothetical protein
MFNISFDSLPRLTRPSQIYCLGLAFYLAGRISDLESLVEYISISSNIKTALIRNSSFEDVKMLLKVRLSILKRTECETLDDDFSKSFVNPILNGELYFCLGRYSDAKMDNSKAIHFYNLARVEFENCNFQKKSLQAHVNHLICEERLALDRSKDSKFRSGGPVFFDEYYRLCLHAIKLQEYRVAGTLLTVISQKLMDIGALKTALIFANRSLGIFSVETGSTNQLKALLNRAQIHYLLGNLKYSQEDIALCEASPLVEIKVALSVLKAKIAFWQSGPIQEPIQVDQLSCGWQSRFNYLNHQFSKMTPLEEKVVHALIRGPRVSMKLISKLWPNEDQIEYSRDRFKKLISRLRMKYRNMFIFRHGYYYLNIHGGAWTDFAQNNQVFQNQIFNGAATRPLNCQTGHFTDLEYKFLKLISSESLHKIDILRHIYPDESISFSVKENRFKQLLFKLKIKIPGKIWQREGVIRLEGFDFETLKVEYVDHGNGQCQKLEGKY